MPPADASIRSLLLTTAAGHLLLPKTVVAEILPYAAPARPPQPCPQWLLGSVDWRGHGIPLICIGRLLDAPLATAAEPVCNVVLKALGRQPAFTGYAIAVGTMPRSIKVRERSLAVGQEPAGWHPAMSCRLRVLDEPAWVPNLDYLERQLSRALAGSAATAAPVHVRSSAADAATGGHAEEHSGGYRPCR